MTRGAGTFPGSPPGVYRNQRRRCQHFLACQRRVEQGQRVNYFRMVEFLPHVRGESGQSLRAVGLAQPGLGGSIGLRRNMTIEQLRRMHRARPFSSPPQKSPQADNDVAAGVSPAVGGRKRRFGTTACETQAATGLLRRTVRRGVDRPADVGPCGCCGTGILPVVLVGGSSGTGILPVKVLWRRHLACGLARAIAGPKTGFRTFRYGKMGNLGKLCGIMSPAKTVSKLRSTPAPYLAQTPAPKLGVAVDLNRCRDRVSCLLGPDLTETRTLSHRGTDPTSPR